MLHVLLDADTDVLRSRIEQSPEARTWRLAHLDRYTAARPWMSATADLVVDTTAASTADVAAAVVAALGQGDGTATASCPDHGR